eukprot:SM000162S02359  [mRNA]  locus=s162:93761:95497:+ [translate_table: standard]
MGAYGLDLEPSSWAHNAHSNDAIRYDETGFTVSGVDVSSSVICVGDLCLQWAPRTIADVTPESLQVFQLLRPLPELLLLGCGSRLLRAPDDVRKYLQSLGIKLEAVATRNAASTYNILTEEGRKVAAALLIAGVD